MTFLKKVMITGAIIGGLLGPAYVGARVETGYWSVPKQIEWEKRYQKLYGEVQQMAETGNQRCCDAYEVERILKKRGIETKSPGINPTIEQLKMAREILAKEKN